MPWLFGKEGKIASKLTSATNAKHEDTHLRIAIRRSNASSVAKPTVRVTFDETLHFANNCLETCCAVVYWGRTDRRLVHLQNIHL